MKEQPTDCGNQTCTFIPKCLNIGKCSFITAELPLKPCENAQLVNCSWDDSLCSEPSKPIWVQIVLIGAGIGIIVLAFAMKKVRKFIANSISKKFSNNYKIKYQRWKKIKRLRQYIRKSRIF